MMYLSHSTEKGTLTAHQSKRERDEWCARTGAVPVTKEEAKKVKPTWTAADWRRFELLAGYQAE